MDRNMGRFLLYASLGIYEESTNRWCREKFASLDTRALLAVAIMYGEAGNLGHLVTKADISFPLFPALRKAAERELYQTITMQKTYRDVANILANKGVTAIPLKGADPRIVSVRGPYNPMADVDILVTPAEIEKAGRVLMDNNWQFIGKTSGAHLTYHNGENVLEVHWDLVNRAHPVQGILFCPDMAQVFARCSTQNDSTLLATDDLIAYQVAHGVKEYFHKPKWLADIVKLFSKYTISSESIQVFNSWGVLRALSVLHHACDEYFQETCVPDNYASGCSLGLFLEKIVARHILDYDHIKLIRPLLWAACAESHTQMVRMISNGLKRCCSHV